MDANSVRVTQLLADLFADLLANLFSNDFSDCVAVGLCLSDHLTEPKQLVDTVAYQHFESRSAVRRADRQSGYLWAVSNAAR